MIRPVSSNPIHYTNSTPIICHNASWPISEHKNQELNKINDLKCNSYYDFSFPRHFALVCNTSCWWQLVGETLRSKWGMAASMASKGSVVVARRERQHNRCYKARAPSTRSQSVWDFETMEKKYLLIFALLAVPSSGLPDISLNPRNNLTRNPSELKHFFSIRFQ